MCQASHTGQTSNAGHTGHARYTSLAGQRVNHFFYGKQGSCNSWASSGSYMISLVAVTVSLIFVSLLKIIVNPIFSIVLYCLLFSNKSPTYAA